MFAHSTCVHLSCPLRAFPVHLLLQVLSEMPAGTWREVGVGEKKAGDCSGRGGITMPLTPPALLRIVNAGGLSRAGGWGPASSLPPPHPSALTLPGTSSRLVFRPCLHLFPPPVAAAASIPPYPAAARVYSGAASSAGVASALSHRFWRFPPARRRRCPFASFLTRLSRRRRGATVPPPSSSRSGHGTRGSACMLISLLWLGFIIRVKKEINKNNTR